MKRHATVTAIILLMALISLLACQPAEQSPTPGASPTPTETAAPTVSPEEPTAGAQAAIDLVAQNLAFDKDQITVRAGSEVTINFDNRDNAIPHNFAVYTDTSASNAIFKGDLITGPLQTTYRFKAPDKPGNYFFRCDVHPTTMTGTLIVE